MCGKGKGEGVTREPIVIVSPIDKARKVAAALNGRIVRVDANTAVRFRVIEEAVNLASLRREREALGQALTQPDERPEEILARGLAETERRKADVRARIEQIRELEG